MLRYLPFLLTLALSIYTFIDCLTTPEEDVRNLPKVVWAFIILLFSPIGPIAWLVAGRPRARAAGPYQGPVRSIRKMRTEPARYIPPDDNPEFLASLKKENERRKRHEEEMRRGSEHSGEQDGEPEDERKRD